MEEIVYIVKKNIIDRKFSVNICTGTYDSLGLYDYKQRVLNNPESEKPASSKITSVYFDQDSANAKLKKKSCNVHAVKTNEFPGYWVEYEVIANGFYYTVEQRKLEIEFSNCNDKPIVHIDGKTYQVLNYKSKAECQDNPELIEEKNGQMSFGF